MIILNDNYERPILMALSEDSGRLTGQIANTFSSPFRRSLRQHSSDVRAWLIEMEKRGLVKRLDDQNPVAWMRTKRGSKELKF